MAVDAYYFVMGVLWMSMFLYSDTSIPERILTGGQYIDNYFKISVDNVYRKFQCRLRVCVLVTV